MLDKQVTSDINFFDKFEYYSHNLKEQRRKPFDAQNELNLSKTGCDMPLRFHKHLF